MTKAAALFNYFNCFLPAYPSESVPTGDDKPDFPYLTYTFATGDFDSKVSLTVQLWYRTEEWKGINAKAEEISKAIGLGGKMLKVDGGYIWLTRGAPFAQSMGDDEDNMIKRKYINIDAEYFTQD